MQVEEPMFETANTEMPQDQRGDTKDQPNVKANPMDDWLKKPNKPPTPDRAWNDGKSIDSRPPQKWISNIAKARQPPCTFDELMSTPIDFSSYVMHNLKIDNLTQEILNNPEGHEYPFNLSKPLPLIEAQRYLLLLLVQKKLSKVEKDVIFDLNVALRMFTRRIVILKRVEDLQLGVESSKPETFRSDISKMTPYTAYKNPQGIIYLDKYKRNRLMHSNELYKFCDGTLKSVRNVLYDNANNLRMEYLPKRIWSNLDGKGPAS
ncbi:hypothetical protein Tco_0695380 [Tanacetum coccineum]